jgi:hypothetical protein
LLLYPCAVQVEHDGVGGLIGIGDVRHEGGGTFMSNNGSLLMRLVAIVTSKLLFLYVLWVAIAFKYDILSLMIWLVQLLPYEGSSMQRRVLININYMIEVFTKSFETFVGSIDMNYHEIYYLHQAVSRGLSVPSLFRVEKANHSDDYLIIHEGTGTTLRLTGKARSYLPKWIEENLMERMDAESYYGWKCAKEKD